MMKLAVDMRMSGKSGIGSYFDSLFPFFKENFEVVEINPTIEPFSVKEIFSFPKEELNKINECDAYYTPYCNIPGGIKVPVFSTIHDIVFLDIPLAGFIGTKARKWFYNRACKKSSIIFTVSEFSKERIHHHLNCKKPVVVTYNASPAQYIDSENENSFSNSELNLLYVGNIKKHKGLHILLEAFKKVLQKENNAKLTIVGNAKNFRTGDDSIAKEIDAFCESVNFTGFISNEELNKAYHNATLLVQPSFYEGFGMPPLEALNCGTNVVLSDIPVFKEIYKDFPVTFFECGNSDDLAEKILLSAKKERPENLPQIYSFERTFSIIKETITETCNK